MSFGAQAEALIRADSDRLSERWLRLLGEQGRSPRGTAYADNLAREQVQAMLETIACELSGGVADPDTLLRQVRAFAKVRYAQGKNAEEVDAEIDLLGRVAFDAIAALCQAQPEVTAIEALEVVRRAAHAFERLGQDAARCLRESLTSDSLQRAALLDDFGRAVTHELRNRLNPISLSLALLEQPELRVTSPESVLERLRTSLRRVESVVPDVFAVAVARGRADGEGEHRQALSDVVRQTIVDMSELSGTTDVVVTSGPIPDLAIDPVRVSLVLLNLLSNAIKYSDYTKAERTVHVSCTLENDDAEYVMRVADNGIGIPEDMRARIFERYVRGEHESVQGEGIGLSLARKAVHQLGGRIWVESRDGGGSTFCFTLRDPARWTAEP